MTLPQLRCDRVSFRDTPSALARAELPQFGESDSRLYRIEHGTFEEYCREKWQMTDRHARNLIAASIVTASLSKTGTIVPKTENQARPLTKLPPEKQAEAWQGAVEAAGGQQPTAKQVEVAVIEVMPSAVKQADAKVVESSSNEPSGDPEYDRYMATPFGQAELAITKIYESLPFPTVENCDDASYLVDNRTYIPFEFISALLAAEKEVKRRNRAAARSESKAKEQAL